MALEERLDDSSLRRLRIHDPLIFLLSAAAGYAAATESMAFSTSLLVPGVGIAARAGTNAANGAITGRGYGPRVMSERAVIGFYAGAEWSGAAASTGYGLGYLLGRL